MPPKQKYTREAIIDAAYSIMEHKGMDAVVAREVGKALGATVAPIFTYFENMEELRAAVHEKAIAECTAYFHDFSDYFPAFKEFGLRWVQLAKERPHVYSEVFIRKTAGKGLFNDDLGTILEPVRTEIVKTFSVTEADAENMIRDLLLYVHGLASLYISGLSQMTDEELRISLSRLCLSYVAGCQVRDGILGTPQLHTMFHHLDMVPHKKSELGGIPFESPSGE